MSVRERLTKKFSLAMRRRGSNDSWESNDMEMSSDSADFLKDLEGIAEVFKKNVQIEDRTYHFKTYKDCFVGREAVDYLVSSGSAPSRLAAVELGRALQATYLFEHVTRDHQFSDDYLFFRFLEEGERGEFKVDKETGEKIEWNQFLAPVTSTSNHGPWQPKFATADFESMNAKDVHVASQLWPMDSHNTTLLNNVHPPEWQDPKACSPQGSSSYDLVVIGGGTGGLIAASGSAGVGAKVALIEEHMLGGDCLNVGCVPSKAIIHSANLAHQLKGDSQRLEEAGIFLDPAAVTVNFEKVMERVRKVRAQISSHDSATRYSKELGVEVFIGRGFFTSEKSVVVNGRTLNFKRAVIATGGYPTLIPMPGLKDLHYQATSMSDTDSNRPAVMTNETFFNLTRQPKHMVVIGGGVVGSELGQAMQRLGTSTTVLGRSGRILPKEDEDMAEVVKQQMIKDGVTFRLSVVEYQKIELTGSTAESGFPEMKITILEKGASEPTTLTCDAVLAAAGRRPNVTGMDLELAKVQYDTTKGLIVNDKLQTSNHRVYGVGDCCQQYKFTHAADFTARAVIRNALFFGKEKLSDLLIPYATFTSPEIASVGLYGTDLDEQGIEYRTIEKHFKDNDRSICEDTTEGFVRFRVDAKKDTILGASVVGKGAGNLISEVTLAMKSETGLGAMANVIHPYPTTAEVIRQSGDIYNKTKLTTTVKTLLRGIVKLQT